MESDWCERTSQLLLCLGKVATELKPNRSRAEINMGHGQKRLLSTANTVVAHKRTADQMLSEQRQTHFTQGGIGNSEPPVCLRGKASDKSKRRDAPQDQDLW